MSSRVPASKLPFHAHLRRRGRSLCNCGGWRDIGPTEFRDGQRHWRVHRAAVAEVEAAREARYQAAKELFLRDVRIEVFSNMAGCAVRVTHLPSGLAVSVDGPRNGQLMAREEALRLLADQVRLVTTTA